ncbi:hypothetical protein [Flavobacterium sp.]|uniref:hypothetical protein n=1 Tax=Flavobacterium sp. TaxID=239 RepID=UPI0035B41B70
MKYQPELTNLLLFLEYLSCFVGILFSYRIRKTYWIWFVVYLIVITINDFFVENIVSFLNLSKQKYYAYIIIPLQFIFFYWLYALKSLKNKKLFIICTGLYLASFMPVEMYFSRLKVVYSFNYVVGTLFLMILVFLEYRKQIMNDNILEFKSNKMFYINLGILLFYVGTLPFFGLYNLLVKQLDVWNIYYIYFLVSNCLMYALFSASFIWGKPK